MMVSVKGRQGRRTGLIPNFQFLMILSGMGGIAEYLLSGCEDSKAAIDAVGGFDLLIPGAAVCQCLRPSTSNRCLSRFCNQFL